MKTHYIILLLALFLTTSMVAQNRSIAFVAKDWKQAVAKARNENKLIFLDCYTSWCGPCKNLAQHIFTQDAVADFYNRNFVNVSMDMEKDVDGVMLSKVYKPNAFPTLLFIDPYTQLVVHRVTGAGDASHILSVAAEALASENTLAGACRRYRRGDRSPDFVRKLMNDLKLAGVAEMHREVTEAYFATLDAGTPMGKADWELFKTHVDNPYSAIFRQVVQQREAYAAVFGDTEVALALQWVVILELGDIARGMTATNRTATEARYRRLIAHLAPLDFPGVAALLTDLRLSLALVSDSGAAWRVVRDAYRENPTGDEFYQLPNMTLRCPLAVLVPVMDEQFILTELLGIIDRIKLRCSSMPYLARLALDKSLILAKKGDTEGAQKARNEYEQYCNMR